MRNLLIILNQKVQQTCPTATQGMLILLIVLVLASGCIQGAEVSIKNLTENREQYKGKEINVSGVADAGRTMCTLIFCSEENPCCNSCSGNSVLKDGEYAIEIRGEYNGKVVGCSGDNCNISCYPMERGKKYKVTGIFEKENEDYYLELKNFEGVGQ